MTIIFTLFFNVALVALAYRLYIRRHQRILHEAKIKAQDRLLYIRMLIEQVYIYKHQPEQLLEHLQREMSIRQLMNYHVIDNKCEAQAPPGVKCHPRDHLLYMLHQEGFTPRELCTIFGLNNLNSVYVKCHRMNRKLSRPDSEELPGMPVGVDPTP